MTEENQQIQFTKPDAGRHRATLRIKDAEIPSWKKVEGRWKKDYDNKVPGYRLVWQVIGPENCYINEEVPKPNKLNKKSKLFSTTQRLSNSLLDDFFEDDECIDPIGLKELFLSHSGKEFKITVKVSDTGWASITKYEKVKDDDQTIKPLQTNFEEDEIPW